MKDNRKTKAQLIAELKQVRRLEARYKQSDEWFHLLIENSPDFIYIADRDGMVTYINRTLPQHTKQDIIGRTVYDFALPEFHDSIKTTIAKVFATGCSSRYDTRAPGPNDIISFYETRCLPLIRDGKVEAFIGVSTDITERKRAEEALRKSEEKWRSLAETAPVMITHVDCDGLITSINRVPEGMKIAEGDIIGRSSFDFTKEQYRTNCRNVYKRVLKTGISESYEKQGSFTDKWYHATVGALKENDNIIGLTVINVDITERKQAEEEKLLLERQVQQAQKMESLGVLAGGIAHDFNNLLMGVLGNADLALINMTKEAPGRENIYNIQIAAERAAELAGQMLAYSGKGRFVVKCMDLQFLVEEMVHLIESAISKKAIITYDFAIEVPPIKADPTQMRQVIMNLVINAAEAIGDKNGVIAIRTGSMECDRAYLNGTHVDSDLEEGTYSYFEVSDTGSGMDRETISKIFDPFFSTKFTGRGLGLAAVLGIVRGHKGVIKLSSEPGRGTTFKALFPAVKDSVDYPREQPDQKPDRRLKGRTVLLVDDEETVRKVGKEMLKALGLNAVTAVDGIEALAIFKKTPDKFDHILLDLTMPHLNGEETYREMRRIKKDISVILSSGYTEQDLITRFAGKGFAGFIQKPYSVKRLEETLLGTLKDK